jgi:hypothetical protein
VPHPDLDELDALLARSPRVRRWVRKSMRAAHRKGLRAGAERERGKFDAMLERFRVLKELNGTGDVFKAAWDESKHPRDRGKFATSEGSSGAAQGMDKGETAGEQRSAAPADSPSPSVDPEHPADAKARSLLSRLASVPGAVRRRVSEFIAHKYAGMVERYGEKGAKAVMAATILVLPIPGPTSVIPIAIAEAVLKIRSAVRGKPAGETEAKAWPFGDCGCDNSEFVGKAWNPDEHPRDDRGRFVDAHDLHAAMTDPAKAAELRAKVTKPEERAKLDAAIGPETRPVGADESPVHCGDDIKRAAKLLAQGRRVELAQPEQVATLIERMGRMVRKAIAKGRDAPVFDLCKVTVPGTNLFCQETVGFPRVRMPQMRGWPEPGSPASGKKANKAGKVDISAEFIDHLQSQGIVVERLSVRASHLRASQNEIDGARVAQLVGESDAGTKDLRERPIFVTRDNYVLDGHHHWAAIVGVGYGRGKDLKVPVYKLDMDIGRGIHEANAFAKKMGLKPKAVAGAPAVGKGFDPNEARDESGKWTSGGAGGSAPDRDSERQADWLKQQKQDARAAVDWEATAKQVKARAPSKQLKAATKYRDAARRRRVIKAVRNEGELATAIQGHNLPDSEPADVVHILDATGKPVTDPEAVKYALKVREAAVKALKLPNLHPRQREAYEHVLAQPAHFFEVKTLLTTAKDEVHMSKAAMKRKERWMSKYGITFHTVALDDRKGKKHSGHRVYVIPNAFGSTVKLADMQKADSLAAVMDHATGKHTEAAKQTKVSPEVAA